MLVVLLRYYEAVLDTLANKVRDAYAQSKMFRTEPWLFVCEGYLSVVHYVLLELSELDIRDDIFLRGSLDQWRVWISNEWKDFLGELQEAQKGLSAVSGSSMLCIPEGQRRFFDAVLKYRVTIRNLRKALEFSGGQFGTPTEFLAVLRALQVLHLNMLLARYGREVVRELNEKLLFFHSFIAFMADQEMSFEDNMLLDFLYDSFRGIPAQLNYATDCSECNTDDSLPFREHLDMILMYLKGLSARSTVALELQ